MNFGTAWRDHLGDIDKETVFNILEYFYDQGGNFIDTANNYQDEESEKWIGEWMQKTGRRHEMVIATKYTTGFQRHNDAIQANFTGNSRKSLHVSVEMSLKKLQTDYIDILYVHWWDYATPVEEIMQGLNHLVASGKVLYLGISDTPAWIVAKANQYAKLNGLAPFVVYQGLWSIATRDFERDIIPMCKSEGLGLAPWGVLGRGMFKTEAQLTERKETGEKGRVAFVDKNNHDTLQPLVQALEKVAGRKQSTVTGIAQAYVMAKVPYVFPIIGIRKVQYLKDSIDALNNVTLSAEDIKELEDASPIDLGFPHNVIGTSAIGSQWSRLMGNFEHVEEPKAIQFQFPRK
jgi:aryl-alcohol dehydrogenase-like predicted oxidoreductase